jgi:glucose uptake protein
MFVLQSYTWAVVFCVITMFCWGSWANTQKLARKGWRFELFYWDYVIGVLLLSLLLGLTLGTHGTAGRPFLEDLGQASHSSIYSALLGGAIFNLANILLVAAIDIAGMSVAFPVGIGIALVLGVVLNYVADPIGYAPLLFGGVLLVVLAIILDAIAYRKLPGGSAGVSTKGLILSVACGLSMGFFYRFVAAPCIARIHLAWKPKLRPYGAVFIFAVGIFISNFLLNTLMMKKPFVGTPVTYADYFKGGLGTHLTGILGGIIWGVGMSFNIIASGRAGFAISYGLGQGATMVRHVGECLSGENSAPLRRAHPS